MKALRLFILLLIVISMIFPVDAQQGGEPTQSYFSQISHSPSQPIVNTTVQFHVSLRNLNSISVVNVTLQLNQSHPTNHLMQMEDNRYSYETSFPKIGTVYYRVRLFSSQGLAEESNWTDIKVQPGQQFQNRTIQQMTAGNHSLVSADGRFRLQLRLQKAATISINQTSYPQLNAHLAVSPEFNIDINDTEAIIEARLTLSYNQTQLEQQDMDPKGYRILSRLRNTSVWTEEPSTLNESDGSVTTTMTHFSSWVLAATLPQIRITNLVAAEKIQPRQYLAVEADIHNFGALTGYNLSVRLIHPVSVLSDSNSSFIIIGEVTPQTDYHLQWHLFFEKEGTYNLVLIAEGENIDGDVVVLNVIVEPLDEQFSSNSETFYPILGTIVMMIIRASVIRKRS